MILTTKAMKKYPTMQFFVTNCCKIQSLRALLQHIWKLNNVRIACATRDRLSAAGDDRDDPYVRDDFIETKLDTIETEPSLKLLVSPVLSLSF